MSNNTYVKIVNEGYPRAIEDLPACGTGQEVIPFPEGCSVEVVASILNAGNIIIYRDIFTREIKGVTHTPHKVYIQEQRQTISTFNVNYPMLMGISRDGEVTDESELLGDETRHIHIPQGLLDKEDPEVAEAMCRIVHTLNCIHPDTIATLPEYERFNIPCRLTNPGLTDLFAFVQERIADVFNINVLPVSMPNTRNEVDYFCIEHIRNAPKIWFGKTEELAPVKDPELDPNLKLSRGTILKGTLLYPDTPPMVDLSQGGQYGPGNSGDGGTVGSTEII